MKKIPQIILQFCNFGYILLILCQIIQKEVIMNTQAENEKTCCPKFDPIPWDGKLIKWEDRKFIRAKVCTFFYMPVNFGRVMIRLNKIVEKAGATMPDFLCLSDHTSKWNMDLYLAVDKEVPGTENVSFSGLFYFKVYEGAFRDVGKWCKDFEQILKSKEFKYEKIYTWYTTCPKCAKKYGKNYVVLLTQVE